mmetsp:Transcript_44062/g.139909  ORF Transcript_44062/g.139909 Transcript_44062/m.139909 type:complete len:1037 (-) Transcript_44062:650-3760(-)
MVRCQEAHPDFCAAVTWDGLAWHLLWMPALALTVLMSCVMPVLHHLWIRNSRSRLVRKIRRVIGSVDSDKVRYPLVLNSCFLLEMTLSIWFAVQWVLRSYVHTVTESSKTADQILCCFFLVTYLVNAMRNQFAVTYTLQPTALITLFTVVPTFMRPPDDRAAWFSFSYLRIANAVNAYEKLEKTGALRDVSEMKRGYAVTLLRTMVLVVILSGTTFSLEVLGDPAMFVDSPVTTDMGQISFIQMVYWIFTTISTVGYGDFSPTTTLSRLFIIMAIIVGVCFFSTEVGNLMELHKLQSSGQGKWKPYKGNSHVIVIGGGVRGSSSVLKSFLDEIFSHKHGSENAGLGWPNVSFMASADQPRELREAIASLPRHARARTNYFMGDPTRHQDMERLRMGEADLVVIITDLNAPDIDQEDTSNILRALAVKQSHPHVNLRLMLQRPASKVKAVRAGIWPSRCFSINEMKCALFGLSCPVRGWSTMVAHCLISEDDGEDGPGGPVVDEEGWFTDFKQGRDFNLGGFLAGHSFAGVEFLAFVRQASRMGVMPIAVQVNGTLDVNPIGYTLQAGDVVFAFHHGSHYLKHFEEPGATDWRAMFLSNQQAAVMDVRTMPSDPVPVVQSDARFLTAEKPGISPSSPSTPSSSKPGLRRLQTLLEFPMPRAVFNSAKDGIPSLEDLEKKANSIAADGGHYILVILAGNPWNQMQALLRTLRGKHLPFHVPIVILSSAAPSSDHLASMFKSTPRLGLIQTGKMVGVSDLSRAGMMEARCIMLYAGNASEAAVSDRRMLDGAGVTMLAAIEGALCETESAGTHIVLELHRQESVKFMHRFPLTEDHYSQGSEWKFDPNESFTNHPRFASGSIFTASCLGALVARSFYTPGIVELLENMVLDDGLEHPAHPWQVALPEGFADKTYGELVEFLCDPSRGALCLGLYRRCFPGMGSSSGYVMTNPKPVTKLRADDLVTVLAPASFGRDCFEKNMVVGVMGAPSADEPEEGPRVDSKQVFDSFETDEGRNRRVRCAALMSSKPTRVFSRTSRA